MTLAVGHGYELAYLLDLSLPAFDQLVESILRVSKDQLLQTGMMLRSAAHADGKDFVKYLKTLTSSSEALEDEEHSSARDAMNAGQSGVKKRGKRRAR